jgi:hypothetical protein
MGGMMAMLVELFEVDESKRENLPLCEHCNFIPAWKVSRWPSHAKRSKAAYACSEHVDSVLFDVQYGRAGEPLSTKEVENQEPGELL